jgi:hypothetical protein
MAAVHGSRLDPLLNDSIKVPVNVTYSDNVPAMASSTSCPTKVGFTNPMKNFSVKIISRTPPAMETIAAPDPLP